jgi:GxxExxY protein
MNTKSTNEQEHTGIMKLATNTAATGSVEARGLPSIYPEGELTGKILEAAFAVHNSLGVGFVEKVYENALLLELRAHAIACEQQVPFTVRYRGKMIGEFQADIVVEGRVIVELKATQQHDKTFEAQLLNYLRASGIRVGPLLNFGRARLHYRRYVV